MANKLTDLRDVRFALYEQLGIEALCESQYFEDHSKDTFEMIFDAAEKLAVNEFAPTNSKGDELGCTWEEGVVKVPAPFHGPFKKYCEGGWISMPESYDVGGQSVPVCIQFACKEMFYAANYALTGYMGITHSAAKVIEIHGTEEQKNKYMLPLYEGRYAGAMDLTEAQAGSDVGAIRTKAVKNADGSYSIVGNKMFITGGEQDLTENIIHILLARIEGDPEGTKGLSCFIVPKRAVGDDGALGEKNDINCSGIEHKMGFKGSATCVLNYGDNGVCTAELLGPAGKGIVVMFHMMNEQRVLVGAQGLSQGSTAYLHALQFVRERLQGTAFGSRDHKQVPILQHPDVRRNMLWMKAYTEGIRGLILYTVYAMDRMTTSKSEEENRAWHDVVEVLTPVCKAYGTEKGFDVTTRAIQVHGGYGYCTEYFVEQFSRDSKIATIFEGTNGIQALDLFGRKVQMRGGEALKTVLDKMKDVIRDVEAVSDLSAYTKEVQDAISVLENVTRYLLDQAASGDAYLAYSWASAYLDIFGDVMLGWILLWQAGTATENAQENSADRTFYESKISTAKFYIASLLPATHGKISAIKKGDKSFLNMGEDIFPE
jgi:alkylation response protein AidB-like acyl-CoA dehydrogenase